jgi:hypothetical protein
MCLESLAEILFLCYSLFLLIGRASRIRGKLFFNKPLVRIRQMLQRTQLGLSPRPKRPLSPFARLRLR